MAGHPARDGLRELLLRRFWEEPREIKVATGEGGHGGGDVRMLEDLFGTLAPPPCTARRTRPTEPIPS
ncbi:hypothetical protein [Streptomyces violaceus]|uniref:Uncharacterized protein n=1 Tax=Streptomyces violaceus TaxID=1936 RepID=A0ABY9UJ89_STRVL|nr:hypothetical protein [Streptomyces janthinus]WND22643.1 hypothetical protein RI060_37150 [Streptomyces janthinus]GGS87047.1 hypothetical protein GCM10010270_69040 [Streptomyces janthinus]